MCTSAGRAVAIYGVVRLFCLVLCPCNALFLIFLLPQWCRQEGKMCCTFGYKRGYSEDAKVSTVMCSVERRAVGARAPLVSIIIEVN